MSSSIDPGDRKAKLSVDHKPFLEEFARKIQERSAAIFAGAGLSRPSGYVNWKTLLEPLASDLGLQIEKEMDLVKLAQFSVTKRGSRSRITDLLVKEFSPLKPPTENHKILAALPIDTYWTTNYDTLLERTLESLGKMPDVKRDFKQITYSIPGRDVVVYKMHGDVDAPNDIVITKEDYEQYTRKKKPFIDALMAHLVSKVFLFIGFSFTDPNLDAVLARLRLLFSDDNNTHWALFKTDIKEGVYSDDENKYIRKKEDLVKADLLRVGVQAIFVESFDDITLLLELLKDEYEKQLKQLRKNRSVLIVGSADDWGSWADCEAKCFLNILTIALLQKKWRIVTSSRNTVSLNCLINAIDYLSKDNSAGLADHLLTSPTEGEWSLQEDFKLFEHASAAVFLFGNSRIDGQIFDSPDMKNQFYMARQEYKQMPLIPVGATGFMANQLFKTVQGNFNDYYPVSTNAYKIHFETLSTKDNGLENLIGAIIAILDLWRR